MLECFSDDHSQVEIVPLTESELAGWLGSQPNISKKWVQQIGFTAKEGTYAFVPNEKGELIKVLLGIKDADDFWAWGALPNLLPEGVYQFSDTKSSFIDTQMLERAGLAWGLGSYRFAAYREVEMPKAQLQLPKQINQTRLDNLLRSIYLARDLINTPCEDMGPSDLAAAVGYVAEEFGAQINTIIGDDLLQHNYPAVHAVGRAGAHPPRVIDMQWGDPALPKIALVGKGVCFDTGGLDLKSSAAMLLMKKDMAGAAIALSLARLIMAENLPVCLRLIIPAVENAISGDSYRPGDVVHTRAGKTVEITNTDAEGRVVLCDALYEAAQDKPDCLIDFSTLTGAARVALGPEVAALFTNNDQLANDLARASQQEYDPLWRLPLYAPYKDYLKSQIADICNASLEGSAGAIVAALYLQEFVNADTPWVHFDLSAWNYEDKPGRPVGAEAKTLRAVYRYIYERFS